MTAYRVFLIVCLSLFRNMEGLCENLTGDPHIINFSEELYNAGTQNWEIVQDENNLMYFANNEGLLTFDGTRWTLYTLPNKSVVRSLYIGKDKRIYTGGQNDFGYFAPNRNGKLVFTSLKTLLTNRDLVFTDIWDIIPFGNDIFFRGRDRIFRYDQKKIEVYKNEDGWRFLGLHHNKLIAQNAAGQLLVFTGTAWQPFLKKELPGNFLVTASVPFGPDSSLITTQKAGAYILANDSLSVFTFRGDPFSVQLVLTARRINENSIAVGTNTGGCFIVNNQGQVIQNISRKDGLQNNTIVSIFCDKQGNLWLGTDNGIDFIAANNAIEHIFPDRPNEGVGYSSILFKNELYFGTSHGVFKKSFSLADPQKSKHDSFVFVPGITGPVWSFTKIGDELLIAGHEGAFLVKEGKLVNISTHTGYWNFSCYSTDNISSLLIAGTYRGIEIFEHKNNFLTRVAQLPGFRIPARSVVVDENKNIWVGTLFNGIYKVSLNRFFKPTYKVYGRANGLPGSIRNRIFKIGKKIVAATENGVYEYDSATDLFEPGSKFTSLKNKDIRLLKEDENGNVWFIEGKSVGVYARSGKVNSLLYFPELDGKMVSGNSLEFVYPYTCENILVGSETGFYDIRLADYKKNVYLTRVKVTNVQASGDRDTLLFGGYHAAYHDLNGGSKDAIPEISHTQNSFHFEYSSPCYGYQQNVQYSVMLQGFDRQWSPWVKKTQKDFTNLPPGTFTFRVKAKTNLGKESNIDSYSFIILPPWYHTWWAYVIYGVLLAGLILTIHKQHKKLLLKQQKKHQEEQRQLQYLYKLELENSEKEIIALRNQKLKAELEGKNSELASVAMHIVHKGEMLSKIKDELVRLKKSSDVEGASDNVSKIIKSLNEEARLDQEWDQFATHFDSIHSNFIKALKAAYPNLTHNDVKLCTYLQMNLSSKEIAQLLNISVRGVEISRYRLRKKLQIPTETNLYYFFLEFLSSREKHNLENEGSNTTEMDK